MKIIVFLVALFISACGQATTTETAGTTGGQGGSNASSVSAGGSGDCQPGTKRCGSACVPIDSPSTGCSGDSCDPCSFPNGVAVCAGGACALAGCVLSFADCDGQPSNGCETPTSANMDHCGSCNAQCSFTHASAACIGGTCTQGACDPGWGACTTSACDVNITSSIANCGACGHACQSGEKCVSGSCESCTSISMPTGKADSIAAKVPDWPVWKHVPKYDSIVSTVHVSILNPLNLPWRVSIYADDGTGTKPGLPLSQSFVASSSLGIVGTDKANFATPPTLNAGDTYWFVLFMTNGSSSGVINLITVDTPGSPAYWTDGLTLQKLTDQSPSYFEVDGKCL